VGTARSFFAEQLLKAQEYFVYCKTAKVGSGGKELLSTGKVFSEAANKKVHP